MNSDVADTGAAGSDCRTISFAAISGVFATKFFWLGFGLIGNKALDNG